MEDDRTAYLADLAGDDLAQMLCSAYVSNGSGSNRGEFDLEGG